MDVGVTGVPERKQKGLVMSRGPLQVCFEGVKGYRIQNGSEETAKCALNSKCT